MDDLTALLLGIAGIAVITWVSIKVSNWRKRNPPYVFWD